MEKWKNGESKHQKMVRDKENLQKCLHILLCRHMKTLEYCVENKCKLRALQVARTLIQCELAIKLPQGAELHRTECE